MKGHPSRREAIGLLSSTTLGGIAGCLTTGQWNDDPGGTSGKTGQTVSQGLANKLSFSASVLQSFTNEHPGRISISLVNDSEKPLAMGVSHGIRGPFSVIKGDRIEGEEELIILGENPERRYETPPGAPCRSGEYAIPESPTNDCWEPACEIPKVYSHITISIGAGETLEWEYVVLDGFNDACLAPGTYAFAETVPVTYHQAGKTSASTPSGGWSHLLTKQVWLTLESDGTIMADSDTRSDKYGS